MIHDILYHMLEEQENDEVHKTTTSDINLQNIVVLSKW